MEGEKEAWWLDERTKRLIEETMHLNGALTFTVRPGTPLQLTREQVPRPTRDLVALIVGMRVGCKPAMAHYGSRIGSSGSHAARRHGLAMLVCRAGALETTRLVRDLAEYLLRADR